MKQTSTVGDVDDGLCAEGESALVVVVGVPGGDLDVIRVCAGESWEEGR